MFLSLLYCFIITYYLLANVMLDVFKKENRLPNMVDRLANDARHGFYRGQHWLAIGEIATC